MMQRMRACETCGLSFEPKPQRSGRFCSVECFWARGPDGPRKASVKGPRKQTAKGHPLAPPSGVVAVSRLVLFDKIGPDTHPCHWCGKRVAWMMGAGPGASGNLLVDHLDWDDQNNSPENLVPSCNSCNARRAAPGRRGSIQSDEPSLPAGGGYRTRAIEVHCAWCGAPFLTLPSRPRKFCSRGGRGRCANARVA